MSNDKVLSIGIDEDIDLTENNIFRNGAPNPFYENITPGLLPWNSNGELVKKPAPQNSQDTIFWENSIGMWTMNESNSFSPHRYTFSYNWGYSDDSDIKKIDNKKLQSEYIEKLKISNDEDEFVDIVIKLLVMATHIRIDHNNKLCINIENENLEYSDTYSINMLEWIGRNTSPHNFVYNTIDKYSKTNSEISIYPIFLPVVNISSDEINGRVIITGKQPEISSKLKVIEFRRKISNIINRYYPKRKNNAKICSNCGCTWIPLSANDRVSKECPYCNMQIRHKATSFTHSHRWIDIHLDIDHIREDCRYFYRDSYWGYNYFTQPRYDDRGVHLLRLRRGDHELQINYDKEFDKYDDDNEQRDSMSHYLINTHNNFNSWDWF